MKKFLFQLFAFSIVFLSCTTNKTSVTTSLFIDVVPENQADTSLCIIFPNCFKIQQEFQFKNYLQDTIILSLENSDNGWLNEFLFQKIELFSIVKSKKDTIAFTFSENKIKFASPAKNCKIEIEYYYQPDYVINGNSTMKVSLTRVSSTWHSWYFTLPNVKIKKIEFDMPENTKLITSLPQKNKKHKVCLDCTKISYYGVTFLVLENPYYENFTVETGKNKVNIFAFKGTQTTSDTTSLSTMYPPKDTVLDIEKYKKYLLPTLNIEKIFDKHISIDIVDGDVSINDVHKMGMGYPIGKNNGFVVMDTSFWNHSEGLHEVIHLYNNILPDRKDTSFYFFNESVTEFLSVYFANSTNNKKDSIFTAKHTKYNDNNKTRKSIFNVVENVFSISDNDTKNKYIGGTYGIVYLKTPYKIYLLAKSVGEDKFISLLSKFYKQVKIKNSCTFPDFQQFMLKNGVTQKQWNDFI
ncbi:MAG: hypothetical protein LBS50_08140, partial [Prevotellaceae bacterium]|nr:hypothetical protein [Prevotellaceae bacterium]